MAKSIDLTKVADRAKLKPRPNPYYMRLEPGFHIGLRVGAGGATWVARRYDQQRQTNVMQALGTFADLPQSERYAAARAAAQAWFSEKASILPRHYRTVAEAAKAYAEANPKQLHLDRDIKRLIENEPIGSVRLSHLKEANVRAWREGRQKLTRNNGQPAKAATVNREKTTLRCVLNYALEQGWVASDAPWKKELAPAQTDNARREVYLSRHDRIALCDAMPAAPASFFKALRLTGLRPGALAALRVCDYNLATSELSIPQDKAGAGRSFVLGKAAAALFKAQCKSKLPTAPLFANPAGGHFDRFQWRDPLREAIAALKLDPRICAYSFRHSAITDMIRAGVDVMTVAKICGTSMAMIDQHYGHLVDEGRALEALA